MLSASISLYLGDSVVRLFQSDEVDNELSAMSSPQFCLPPANVIVIDEGNFPESILTKFPYIHVRALLSAMFFDEIVVRSSNALSVIVRNE